MCVFSTHCSISSCRHALLNDSLSDLDSKTSAGTNVLAITKEQGAESQWFFSVLWKPTVEETCWPPYCWRMCETHSVSLTFFGVYKNALVFARSSMGRSWGPLSMEKDSACWERCVAGTSISSSRSTSWVCFGICGHSRSPFFSLRYLRSFFFYTHMPVDVIFEKPCPFCGQCTVVCILSFRSFQLFVSENLTTFVYAVMHGIPASPLPSSCSVHMKLALWLYACKYAFPVFKYIFSHLPVCWNTAENFFDVDVSWWNFRCAHPEQTW